MFSLNAFSLVRSSMTDKFKAAVHTPYFSHWFDNGGNKRGDENYLREEGLVWFTVGWYNPEWQGWQSCGSMRQLVTASIVRKPREMNTSSGAFFLLNKSGILAQGQCCPHLGWVFPLQLNFSGNIHTVMSRGVHVVIPNQAKLMMKIDHPQPCTSIPSHLHSLFSSSTYHVL